MDDNNEGEYILDTDAKTLSEVELELVRKITHLSSVELRGGFWTLTRDKDGNETKLYIPDTREALTNAIYCLVKMLHCFFDKGMDDDFKKFETTLEEHKQAFLKKTELNDSEILGEDYYKPKEKVFLEEYKIKKVRCYFDLLSDLCKFLKRKPVLGGASGEF